MISVRDVIEFKKIAETLNKMDKCIEHFGIETKRGTLIDDFKKFYIKNNYLTENQQKWLDKYYNDVLMDIDDKEPENDYGYYEFGLYGN